MSSFTPPVPFIDFGYNRELFVGVVGAGLPQAVRGLVPERLPDLVRATVFYYTPWPHINDPERNRQAVIDVCTSDFIVL